MESDEFELRITVPRRGLDPEVLEKLRRRLERCPDVAFAHLPEVQVVGRQDRPGLVLFVWLLPGALRSLRSALNVVCEEVAAALPPEMFVDVVILNSAPEMLEAVEGANCLLVERDPEERQRALEAASCGGHKVELQQPRRWWWPF